MDFSSIMVSLIVGTVGFALFIYGKKQFRLPQMAVGVILMVYPYFVSSALLSIVVFVALIGLLWFLVRREA